MQLLLGIDIGTSACKVACFSRQGEVLASKSAGYPVYRPESGWAEQDPEQWWEAIGRATKAMLSEFKIDASDIAGVGIDGQSWSAIAIDKKGGVLTNTPIWMDMRSQSICDELNERIGAEKIFQLAGNSLQPAYTTAKILWYQKYKPEIYPKIYKILQSNSFIGYRLTGAITQDFSQAYGLHCFDMEKGQWDDGMCQELGIKRSFLPEIVPCHQVIGTVHEQAAKYTGLALGTPVVAGGLDAACGTLGAGVIDAGETQEQGGQAGGMSICMEEYKPDERLILGYHVVPGKYLLQGGTTGGGGVMRWLEEEFGDYERGIAKQKNKNSFDLMGDLAAQIPVGSDGMVFLPYMSGERSPIWDKNAKGVYFGIDFQKTKGHFIRSAMEGVVYALKHNLDVAKDNGVQVNELRSMGGSANSLLWTQMKADITGKPIVVPSSDTATTLGAAILAGVGTGVYKDFDEAVKSTVKLTRSHQPNMDNYLKYQDNYQIYLKLYEQLKGLMSDTKGVK